MTRNKLKPRKSPRLRQLGPLLTGDAPATPWKKKKKAYKDRLISLGKTSLPKALWVYIPPTVQPPNAEQAELHKYMVLECLFYICIYICMFRSICICSSNPHMPRNSASSFDNYPHWFN